MKIDFLNTPQAVAHHAPARRQLPAHSFAGYFSAEQALAATVDLRLHPPRTSRPPELRATRVREVARILSEARDTTLTLSEASQRACAGGLEPHFEVAQAPAVG